MTYEEFKQDVETALGGNLVSVELEDRDYQLAMRSAIRRFKHYGHNTYRRIYVAIAVEEGVSTYEIPDNVKEAIKVIRPSASGLDVTSGDLFHQQTLEEMMMKSFSGEGCNGYILLQHQLMSNRMEENKKRIAEDVDFQIDPFRSEVTFFNTPKLDGEVWFLEAFENLTEEEYVEIDWVFRWAVSEAKLLLGQAYRKFSNLSSPDGSVSLAGSEMIQEAREEQRILTEEIESLVDGAIDYYGIYMG